MLKLGMIGCGGISNAHAAAAKIAGRELAIVACCDVDQQKAHRWAHRHGVPAVYADIDAMLAGQALDGVIIATWPVHHRQHVEQCLAGGIRNILCEKALTLTGADAAAIWQQAKSAGALVMEGFMYRHHPAIARIESILADGRCGPVDRVRGVFDISDPQKSAGDDPGRNWRQQKELGGGVPYDLACYCVNACNHFCPGRPVRVQASGEVSEKYATIHRLFALIEYDGGCVGIVESSNTADTRQELEVLCAKARLSLPIAWSIYEGIELVEQRCTGWVKYDFDRHAIAQANSYALQLANFADVIAGAAKPVMPLEESVADAFTTEAIVTSIMQRRPVEVELPDFLHEALRSKWQA